MGTKIQTNVWWPNHQSVIDLNVNTSISPGFLYCESQMLKNADPLTSQVRKDGYVGFEMEKLRQMILKHETIFRNQLEELHRLYGKQRELMNELSRKRTEPDDYADAVFLRKRKLFGVEILEPSSVPSACISNTILENGLLNSTSSSDAVWKRESSVFNLKVGSHPKSNGGIFFDSSSRIGSTSLQNKHTKADSRGEILLGEGFSFKFGMDGKCFPGNSSVLGFGNWQSQCTEGDPIQCWDNSECLNSKPAKISERYLDYPKSYQKMDPRHPLVLDHQNKPENPRGGLPWFLRNQEYGHEPGKRTACCYFMNIDAVRSHSHDFFHKVEIEDGSFQSLEQKMEISALISSNNPEAGSVKSNNPTDCKKILGFPISDILQRSNGQETGDSCLPKNIGEKDKTAPKNQIEAKDMSNLRYQIDLNLSLDEEDDPPTTPLPTVVDIGTIEIELEAPIQSEAEEHPREAHTKIMEVSSEESDRTAAEAIIAISLSGKKHEFASNTSVFASADCLKWFAEIISSECSDKASLNLEGACDEEESIIAGMDYFEFMTLQLQETTEDPHKYKPARVYNMNHEDLGNITLSRRSRRGQSRRGRQRRDFQTDILPSLATLSRLEVTEDLQAFEQLFEGESGSARFSSKRNGRGRKRSRDLSTMSPIKKCTTSTPSKEELVQVPRFEDRRLTTWGKRTRRMPRQRCSNAILSIPVKC